MKENKNTEIRGDSDRKFVEYEEEVISEKEEYFSLIMSISHTKADKNTPVSMRVGQRPNMQTIGI